MLVKNLRSTNLEERYKSWHLLFQSCSLLVAIIGFFALWSSVSNNAKSARAAVQNNVIVQITNLDKFFSEKPDLYPYFYERKPLKANDPHYQEIIVVAQWQADILDIVSIQSSRFASEWDNPEAWDIWIKDMLRNSPALRDFLMKRRTWYGSKLIGKLDEVQRELQQAPK